MVCDCEILYFVAWLRYNSEIHKKTSLRVSLLSQIQLIVSAKLLNYITKLKVECIAKDVLIGCIVGFLFLNIVLGLLSQLWYKRWKIRYVLAISRKNVTPYHPIEDCEIELEYDVYISYERDFALTNDQTLHEFVAQELYPDFVYLF